MRAQLVPPSTQRQVISSLSGPFSQALSHDSLTIAAPLPLLTSALQAHHRNGFRAFAVPDRGMRAPSLATRGTRKCYPLGHISDHPQRYGTDRSMPRLLERRCCRPNRGTPQDSPIAGSLTPPGNHTNCQRVAGKRSANRARAAACGAHAASLILRAPKYL
jgi:hypothetical protein